MNRFNAKGIILARTNYGEADRIITFLTPDHGKVKALAKGVRKSKSKLAGGIELFSISDIGLLVGRGEINTLISSRLSKHYGNIVKDLDRTNLAYELIRLLHKSTEDQLEAGYFNLLKQGFEALDDEIDLKLTEVWFTAQLLKLAGHTPNLQTEKSGEKLKAGQKYDFNPDTMAFQPGRRYSADHIKFLRLSFGRHTPQSLNRIEGIKGLAMAVRPLVQTAAQSYLRG